jgi:hypothetical protein
LIYGYVRFRKYVSPAKNDCIQFIRFMYKLYRHKLYQEQIVSVQIVSAQFVSAQFVSDTNCIGHKLYRAQIVSGTNCIGHKLYLVTIFIQCSGSESIYHSYQHMVLCFCVPRCMGDVGTKISVGRMHVLYSTLQLITD